MKIVHVVTYVSKDGAFGGPIAVALMQLEELARRGHEVELMAGWDGEASLTADGVKVSLFRARRLSRKGFSGMIAPGLLRALRARAREGAIVHIHLGRDLTTLGSAIALYGCKSRTILQTHGMVMPDRRLPVRLLDGLITRKVLARADAVLALTRDEQQGLREVSHGRIKISEIANGVQAKAGPELERNHNEVVFLARLHPRKRVMYFARMISLLVSRGLDIKGVVIGPDEGDLAELRSFTSKRKLGDALVYEGTLATGAGQERLARATVFVLPSVGEIFPMTVLEAIAANTPVVTTSYSGIGQLLAELEAAIVTDGTPEALADAVQSLLVDPDLRRTLLEHGKAALESKFSIKVVADRLLENYQLSRVSARES